MVKLSLDAEKLMKLIRSRAEFAHMAYPDMTEAQEDELLDRITSDPAFYDIVMDCILIDDEPLNEGVAPFSS